MQIHIYKSYFQLSQAAAWIIATALRAKPAMKLGLATGSTPLGLYAELVRLHNQEHLSFAEASSFNLDEYVGLPADSSQSYRSYMQRLLFAHIDMPAERCFIPDSDAADPAAEAARYAAALRQVSPLDIQVLGIGLNGHIGFNEPGSAWDSRTRVLDLAESTREANARFFDGSIDSVPRRAITMGIADIMEARQVLLLARGADKAEIIAAALSGPRSEQVPASVLQEHNDLIVLLDEEASRSLAENDPNIQRHQEND